MPFAGYADFASCLTDQKKKGKSEESAKKICGYLQARSENKMQKEMTPEMKTKMKACMATKVKAGMSEKETIAACEKMISGKMFKFSRFIPFAKVDEEKRMVYGYASTETLDSDGEIVTKAAMEAALPEYMKFGNIREMHAHSAVGKAKEVMTDDTGTYLGAKVVDDTAWNKVKEGVYNGFSIGGSIIDKIGKKISKLRLSEISLVDRPSNPDATFTLIKAEDIRKDIYSAANLANYAREIAYIISEYKRKNKDTSKLEAILKQLKQVIATDLKEDERWPTMATIELLEDNKDLFKAIITNGEMEKNDFIKGLENMELEHYDPAIKDIANTLRKEVVRKMSDLDKAKKKEEETKEEEIDEKKKEEEGTEQDKHQTQEAKENTTGSQEKMQTSPEVIVDEVKQTNEKIDNLAKSIESLVEILKPEEKKEKKIEKAEGLSKQLDDLSSRLEKLENTVQPSKVSQSFVVEKVKEDDSKAEVAKIDARLEEIFKIKKGDLAKYERDSVLQEEAFELIEKKQKLENS